MSSLGNISNCQLVWWQNGSRLFLVFKKKKRIMATLTIHGTRDLLSSTERKKFLHNYGRIMDFSVQDKEQANSNGSINHCLDELNSLSLDYSCDVILQEVKKQNKTDLWFFFFCLVFSWGGLLKNSGPFGNV